MTKKITTLNIEAEVIEKCKESGFNLSELAEKAMKDKLGMKEIDMREPCFECGRERGEGIRFFWVCPEEIWLCEKCEKNRTEKMKSICAIARR